MNRKSITKFATGLFAALTVVASFQATSEDIDIFAVDEDSNVNNPNVLIILDNSANWSRQSQQWPGGLTQGQSEARAIKNVINQLDGSINVGLMEYITGGGSGDTDFAMIRRHVRPMIAANKASFSTQLDTIFNNINDPQEKRSQGNPFANLMWGAYNYFGGLNHGNNGAGTVASKAHGAAYSSLYGTYRSPLSDADTCTRTIIIFIANNTSSGPSADSQQNVDALRALAGGGSAGNEAVAQIPFADYVTTIQPTTTTRGYTPACYSSQAACNTAVSDAECTENGFTSCSCDSSDIIACPSNHYNVVGKQTSTSTTVISGPTATEQTNQPTGDTPQSCKPQKPADIACPGPSQPQTTPNTPQVGQDTTTQVSWKAGTCTYVDIGNSGCVGQKRNYELRGTRVTTTTVTQTSTNTTLTPLGETNACYGTQAGCNPADGPWSCAGYNGGCECTTAGSTTGCPASVSARYQEIGNYNVIVSQPTGTYSAAPAGPFMLDEWARFLRNTGVPIPGGSGVRTQVTTYTIDVFNAQQNAQHSALLFNAARVGGGKYFQAKNENAIVNALKQIFNEVQAVNSAFSSASLPINATNRTQNENQVFIGVFKPDRTKDPQWFGNLKRFQIIRDAADIDLGDSQNPPQSAINNQTGFLSDCAVSYWTTDTGSYWGSVITDDPDALGQCTTNSTDDHSDSPDGPFVEKGAVAEVIRKGNDPSASPDGDGNYALNRNVYTLSTTYPYTRLPFTAANFDDGNAATDEAAETVIVNFIKGADIDNEDNDVDNLGTRSRTEPRSTIHGDVVHSRPQPINYGDSRGVVVFYGSNDGHYRAVKASTGQELWSFIAPEHHTKLPRLRFSGFAGTPIVRFFGDDPAGSAPKDYFFDGPTATYQAFTGNAISKAMIFMAMRRGGRMIYAFDVTDPTNPVFAWKAGCNAAGACADGTNGNAATLATIAQTWSNPSVATVPDNANPVIITGGGYDVCDDENTKTPCSATRGRGVFVLDAFTGALVKHFDFSALAGVPARGVAADVSLVSVNGDNIVDYVYAADTNGNIFRLDFYDATTQTALTKANWKMSRVAYTNGFSRKFLFGPALFQQDATTVYLALGSGDREHPLRVQYPYGTDGDPSTAVLNRFYVYKDNILDVDAATQANLDQTCQLTNAAAMDFCGTNPGMVDADGASCDTPGIYGTAAHGWFKDLNAYGQGEQVVSSAVIAGGFINFSTNRPTPTSTTACTNSLGEARGYFVNLLTGSGAIGVDGSCGGDDSSTFVGGGLPPSPVIATVKVGDTVETIVIGAVPREGGPGSAISPTLRNPNPDQRRRPVYWYKSSGEN